MEKLLWWLLARKVSNKLKRFGLPRFFEPRDKVRWTIKVADQSLGFSAVIPKDDNEMGAILIEVGKMLQAEKRPITAADLGEA